MRLVVELFLVIVFTMLLFLIIRGRTEQWHSVSNESQAIGDTRTIISANQTYASANCGLYARTLECMTRDSASGICIPGYPDDAPEFLGSDLARPVPYVKSGFERNYTVADVPDQVPETCAGGSPRFFCYASQPARLGVTGNRSFLGTASGDLYFDYDGGDTNCVPVEEAASLDGEAPASIGPPATAFLEGTQPPFSLRRDARLLSQIATVESDSLVPAFIIVLAAYVVYRFSRRTR